jgi:flagellar motor switch protein FliM
MEASIRQTIANTSVQLATGTIKTKEFLNLSVGDVITMDTNPTDEALYLVEGEPKFYGYVGSYRGNRAMRITRPIPQRDLINIRNKQELINNGG